MKWYCLEYDQGKCDLGKLEYQGEDGDDAWKEIEESWQNNFNNCHLLDEKELETLKEALKNLEVKE